MTSNVTDEKPAKGPPPGPISFEEFLEWYSDDIYAEWVDGEIVMAPPPNTEHQMIRDFLVKVVGIYVEAHDLGNVMSAPYLMRTPHRPSGREPDLMFLSKERSALLTHQLLDGPADLTVEVVSPESVGRDRGEKFVEYEAAGVREYWLIDPLRQQAEFYQLSSDGRYRPGPVDADGVYRSVVLDSFWLRIDWLWQRPLPPVLSVLKELELL
jgi:Uma2 family endonuclease